MPVLEKEALRDFGAFRLEYDKDTSDQALYEDCVSYLGEYRFNLLKYSYNLKFSHGKLKDPNRNESMEDAIQRAINLKHREGRSSIREKAELEGFRSLNEQLKHARTGNTIIWMSPPGPKEDGYGDYGFVYFGKVKDLGLDEKRITMTAIRVENPSIGQFQKARYKLTGESVGYEFAEELLDSPKVVGQDVKEGYVDAILKAVFNFKPNEEEQEVFNKIINKMFPLISEFVGVAKNPWIKKQNIIKAFHSLENYFLELKGYYKKVGEQRNVIEIVDFKTNPRFYQMMERYGYEPPKVAGSCGSTGNSNGLQSSNIFNSLSSLNSLFSENSEWFTCPKCNYKAEGPIGNKCPGCGLTKDEYAKESGAEVCE